MIVNFNLLLDLALRVEVTFNMGSMVLQWSQSPLSLDGPIGLRSINVDLTQQDG